MYPRRQAIPSQNVVGTIVQVGENVTRFTSGQRVMA
jgi:NADPH:quinone reductase-like Zn-dependent oxidoreductase